MLLNALSGELHEHLALSLWHASFLPASSFCCLSTLSVYAYDQCEQQPHAFTSLGIKWHSSARCPLPSVAPALCSPEDTYSYIEGATACLRCIRGVPEICPDGVCPSGTPVTGVAKSKPGKRDPS